MSSLIFCMCTDVLCHPPSNQYISKGRIFQKAQFQSYIGHSQTLDLELSGLLVKVYDIIKSCPMSLRVWDARVWQHLNLTLLSLQCNKVP